MKNSVSSALAVTAAAALAGGLALPSATASPPDADHDRSSAASAHRPDNRPGPLTDRQNKLKAEAISALLSGKARARSQAGGGSVVSLGGDKSVELPGKKQARIFSVLAEFGDQVVGRYGGPPGPLHDRIGEPDRSVDNSTIWRESFDREHYEELFNGEDESLKTYYRDISGGRFEVDSAVTDWVRVPYNGAYYGANPREDQGGAWDFVRDSANAWANERPAEELNAELKEFDQWDRYDFDQDTNYNEPDGYIDHFQAIHAGEGEEDGASPDTIWSHRWYAYPGGFGVTGPTVEGNGPNLKGGTRIGNSDYWIGDYTVEPENGGLGVFAHEFAHDLGLPDFYDTAGGDNGAGFWTLMASGSWLSHGEQEGIGTTPNGMGPYERLSLGWLDYQQVDPGDEGTFTLRPAAATNETEANGTTAKNSETTQAVAVSLPDRVVRSSYTTPPEGTHAWWSGRGHNVENTIERTVPAAGKVTVTADAYYAIEKGYDFLIGEYSLDEGKTWRSAGSALTGDSKKWKRIGFSYKAENRTSRFRLRYVTDHSVDEAGAFLDNIVVAADKQTTTLTAEDPAGEGWTADGWKRSTGIEEESFTQFYLLENRAYVGYDKTLETGPYTFPMNLTKPDLVEFFPYQDGMLVWFVDQSWTDNNTSQHPGGGLALPVDARPAPLRYIDAHGNDFGKPGNRRQAFDATFGLDRTDSFCLRAQIPTKRSSVDVTACPAAADGIAAFDDTDVDGYYDLGNPQGSTRVAGHGVRATVTDQDEDALTVEVSNPYRITAE